MVVLISGQGSNLQALIDAQQQGRISGKISAVFSNNPAAYGLERAESAGIPHHALDAKAFTDRVSFDLALAQAIDQYQPDLLVLAGYMRILSPEFVKHYAGRMLNIHPSLLPKYPGLHTHRQALENGDQEHGTSVHFVTEELDGGPVILQAKVPIFSDDSEEDVAERVQTQEHSIYPLVVSWFTDGRLAMRDNAAWLDGVRLPLQGYAAE
ncbi:phosphoribosylglycinamide formyltransferase [Yersinia pestis]|nr:phosphoribosylglycinamide formyltransferase [Yersinia pestis]PVU30366.1 phosphoribosylglycinamide formyltransferase [Yersinia pestis]